jgi:hypothetical protein
MATTIITYGTLVNVAETPEQVRTAADAARNTDSWCEFSAMDESTLPYEPHATKKVWIRGAEVHAANDPQWAG